MLDQIAQLTTRIKALKKTIDTMSKEAETSRRLQTMPGIGPISALAVEAFAPPMEQFKRGRDFAAWLGLPPRLLNAGDLVKVTGGPFAELIGRVESIVPERRIWVLLDLMQRTTRVALASSVLRVV